MPENARRSWRATIKIYTVGIGILILGLTLFFRLGTDYFSGCKQTETLICFVNKPSSDSKNVIVVISRDELVRRVQDAARKSRSEMQRDAEEELSNRQLSIIKKIDTDFAPEFTALFGSWQRTIGWLADYAIKGRDGADEVYWLKVRELLAHSLGTEHKLQQETESVLADALRKQLSSINEELESYGIPKMVLEPIDVHSYGSNLFSQISDVEWDATRIVFSVGKTAIDKSETSWIRTIGETLKLVKKRYVSIDNVRNLGLSEICKNQMKDCQRVISQGFGIVRRQLRGKITQGAVAAFSGPVGMALTIAVYAKEVNDIHHDSQAALVANIKTYIQTQLNAEKQLVMKSGGVFGSGPRFANRGDREQI